jgi:DNA-binding beta-propeller fold protein YncE
LGLSLGSALAGEPAAPPKFTAKPAAAKAGDRVKIEFAVDRETDVAVFIEDAKGQVVRHLAAGVLGKNAPAPLKPGLAQSVEWDGKADWGKPAPAGPFKVRVALGLGAKYDKVLASDPQNIGGPKALAVGPDGTLYVCASAGAALPNWGTERIAALDRDGKYLRTVLPYPANLKKEEVAGYGVYDLAGRPAPLWKCIPQRRFHSGLSPRKGGMAVTPGGVILKFSDAGTLSAIGIRGDAAWGAEGGPKLLALQRLRTGRTFVCASSDGKRAFVTGLADQRPGKKPEHVSFASVYAVKLPERGPGEPLFGKPEEPGKDDAHLGEDPRGVAVDGKGHLLVADFRNDRVVVIAEADGKFVGQFSVPKPDGLGIDPKTGAVYVLSLTKGGSGELVKFSGWKEPKEVARMPVASGGNPDFPPVMAVDASASPVLVWLGTDGGQLIRVEDKGATLEGKPVGSGGKFGSLAFEGIEVDRCRPDREIYVRCAAGTYGGNGDYWRFNEPSGEWTKVNFPGSGGVGGTCIVPGPDGIIYAPAYSHHILRYTRDGKPAPWPEGNVGYPAEALGKDGKPQKWTGPKHGIYGPVSMVYMTHTLGVRPSDGHFFFFDPGHPGDRPHKMLREYTPEGRLVSEDPIIWKASDNCVGPKFDQGGNIYVAEQVKPVGEAYPEEFVKAFGKLELTPKGERSNEAKPLQDVVGTMYGSIVKFSPKGGMFHFDSGSSGGGNPYKGEPKLDPALKTENYASYYGARLYPLKVTGAEWVRMGISHQCLHYCNCENTRFDVDEFGRVWYPDLGRFRVGVLDANGNELARFGGYGNAESCGPESKDQALAEPELAFAWLIGVGATDRYAYMGDSLNRRLLRAKLVYAAEETCEVK